MRRLVLARALLNQPDLLILDEPTIGLDPQSDINSGNALEGLSQQGHLDAADHPLHGGGLRLCDRLIIMDQGRILVEGTPKELIRKHVGRDIIEVVDPPGSLREYVRRRTSSTKT